MIAEGVLVGPRACALLAPWLAGIRRLARTDGATLDPSVVAAIAEIETVSRAYRASLSERVGTCRNAEIVESARVVSWLTTKQTADMLGITPRAVVARIERGSMPAKRVGSRWLVDPINLEET